MSQNRAPLYEALLRYAKKKVVKFHVPGHQYGAGLSKALLKLLGGGASFDLSFLEYIDSLSHPKSVIKEAQELAAQTFGAEETLFLVQGSTTGVLAMILSTCSFNDKILVARNMHQSVVAGLLLSGAKPVYLQPKFDEKFNLPLQIEPETVERALRENKDAKAVLITNPTQFGVCANLGAVAEIVHRAGKLLLVDEAWGAHLKFHQEFPSTALAEGADVVVQSIHKRLPSLSQTSMLHLQGKRLDRARLKKIVRFLQTTSPSYILLASLDLVRQQMAKKGKELWQKPINLSKKIRDLLNNLKVEHLDRGYLNEKGFDLDITNITLKTGNGFEAWEVLNKNNIEPEFATLNHLVFLIGIGNNEKDIFRLLKVLKKIYPEKETLPTIRYPSVEPKISLSPFKASLKETEEILLEKSLGRVAAETIVPYPPGIPLLVPGELITSKILDYLKEVIRYSSIKMQVLGASGTIKVVK